MLSLRSCKVSDECIDKILSGCPILESLKLYFCDELRVLDVRMSQRLRTLEIDRNIWVPGPTQIVAPQIHCLRLSNSQLPCTFVDVSSLTEASLDICFCSLEDLKADFLQVMLLKMLDKLQKCLVKLLQNSPELKKLTVRTMDSGTIQETYIDDYLNSRGLNPDQCWSSEARAFKNVYRWDVESKHVASFMELMLKSAKTLEKMVVMLKGYLERRRFEELLEMVPMLSHNNNNVSIVLSS
ncbi:unnamed protein product [Thlaspi arvense]|uniref:FBD domain-containing protein n=1 Tax=Thlaspi arvense TaxID=13288 RepID=A0AAU9SAN3_THLAR|nr:unnamed protein product [Thlaspi arvense]